MNTQTNQLTIQEVAEATRLSSHTLRYYERIGLIHRIDRADNSHRRYTQADIDWIEFLNKLRATGMSIRDMQIYAELQRQGDDTLPQRLAMLKALGQQLEQHIDELRDHLYVIHYKVDTYQRMIDEQAELETVNR